MDGNNAVLDDASTICSHDDGIDLEALNLICYKISEGLGDGKSLQSLSVYKPLYHIGRVLEDTRKIQELFYMKGIYWNCNGLAD